MIRFIQKIGRLFLGFLATTGKLTLFTFQSLSAGLRPPYYPRQILRQLSDIGYYSLPVVGLTALFTGMVLALQSYTGFSRFSASGAVATVVVLSVTRELAPVLAGLMVAGRIGAAMAAEIGTMRVTEQIDALSMLSTNPLKYLVAPRLIAGVTMLPLLVIVADIIGCCPQFPDAGPDKIIDHARHNGVKSCGGLIEKYHFRIRSNSACQGNATLHSPRKFSRIQISNFFRHIIFIMLG